MDSEALVNLGWREALIAIIALLVLYVALVLLRMRRLRRPAELGAGAPPVAPQHAATAYAAVQDAGAPAPPPVPSEPSFAWNEPPEPFAGQERVEALEREAAQLRQEVGSLRAELHVVNEDLVSVREELQRTLLQSRTVQNASPLYSDAMQMAMQGHSAADISEHCGIARAEAELVVALVRNSDQENG